MSEYQGSSRRDLATDFDFRGAPEIRSGGITQKKRELPNCISVEIMEVATVIPVRNRAKFIARALNSVASQTYQFSRDHRS